MAGAKKVVIIKNQFFHARQPHEGIFEIRSHGCRVSTIFGQSFKWPPLFQEIENWLVYCLQHVELEFQG